MGTQITDRLIFIFRDDLRTQFFTQLISASGDAQILSKAAVR